MYLAKLILLVCAAELDGLPRLRSVLNLDYVGHTESTHLEPPNFPKGRHVMDDKYVRFFSH